MSTVKLVADGVSALLNPACGGRLASLNVGGHELLTRDGPSPYQWGCFTMAPYAGRVRRGRLSWDGRVHDLPVNDPPNALHGLVADTSWDVLDADDTSVSMRCGFGRPWPGAGTVVQRFVLGPDRLDAVLEVHAERDEMPAWSGWHPWFPRTLGRSGPVELDLQAKAMLERDGDGLPTGHTVPVPEGPYDDCFTGVRWPVTLTWPKALRLEITADTDYAVVFTGRPHAVCVEPQTAPPDAVALDRFALVRPGEPLVSRMSWTWSTA